MAITNNGSQLNAKRKTQLTENAPRVFQVYQEQAFRAVGIENGNASSGSNQGKIYTSEITNSDLYNVDYVAAITSFVPNLNGTGQLYNYYIEVEYTANYESGTLQTFSYTSPGSGKIS